jgi:hypothetical protein
MINVSCSKLERKLEAKGADIEIISSNFIA